MVLMVAWDAYGNQIGQNVNSVVGGKRLEENMLRTFVSMSVHSLPPFIRCVASDPLNSAVTVDA